MTILITDKLVHAALDAAPAIDPGMTGPNALATIEARQRAQYGALAGAISVVLAGAVPEDRLEEEIEAISRWCSSETRLDMLLQIVSSKIVSDALFWRVLASEWSRWDATWNCQRKLLRCLRRRRPPPLIADLPEQVHVYRGCSRQRLRAVSWTLDREVAEGFARGHRGIPVPEPVIAEAQIRRENVFLYITDREEHEIVLDPARLFSVTTLAVR